MTTDPFLDRTEYPSGVPCLIDSEQPDPEAAAEFYGGVFGWEFENKLPSGLDDKYLVASLHGFDVAAIRYRRHRESPARRPGTRT